MDDCRDRLPPPPKDAGAGIGPLTGRIEIALADGARVIVDREVDGTALARALSVRQNVTALVRQAGTEVAWTGRWIGTILSVITVTLNEISR